MNCPNDGLGLVWALMFFAFCLGAVLMLVLRK